MAHAMRRAEATRDGLLLTDEDHEPLATGDASVEEKHFIDGLRKSRGPGRMSATSRLAQPNGRDSPDCDVHRGDPLREGGLSASNPTDEM
jgi:hypothetical protein